MFAYRFDAGQSAPDPARLDSGVRVPPPALKQHAAPGPLAFAADPSGPQAFAGTGGPVVGFSVGRVGSEILVNTATESFQLQQQMTLLSNGGFVVTWTDNSRGVGGATGDASNAAVKAQVFDAAGTPVGTEILVNTATADAQQTPQITALSNGGFVVTWTDGSFGVGGATGDASGNAVKAQVFDAAGAPVGTEILVNTATAGNQQIPQITTLSNGGFVVTWATGDNSGAGINAQVFTAAGAMVGSEIAVNTATLNHQNQARITALSDGGFVVTWQDASAGVGGATGDNSGGAIKAQVFTAAGAMVGTEILVNTATANTQSLPRTTALSDGGFVVTWQDSSAGVGGATGDNSGGAIKAQVFTAAGAMVGTEILVNTATESHQQLPQITALSDGGFVVTWQDFSLGVGGATGDASSAAVKAQVFTADGAPVGTEILVNTATAGLQQNPQITALSDGGFVVTWQDASAGVGGATGDNSGDAIKAQVFSAAGAMVGTEILVNTATENGQTLPLIIALPNGGFAITWQDYSAGVGGAGGDASATAVKTQVFQVGLSAIEQVPLDLRYFGFTISDPDADDVLTVTLSADYGILTLDPGELSIGVAGSGTATLTLTGTAAEIGRLFGDGGVFTDAPLLTFTADTDTPPASATLTLTADDGAGGVAVTSAPVFITDTFDLPVGTAGDDTIAGSAADETIEGHDGDDILSGGGGNDILNGGAGSDTANYAAAAAGVTARLNTGFATDDGDGGVDTLISIENLVGSDFNDLLVGSAGANVLNGGLGADYLLGLAGDDILIGGAGAANQLQGGLGDDTYVVTANDTLIEFANEGTDTVQTDRATYVLKTHFENLTYIGAGAFRGVGNAADNVIIGGAGDDVLAGLGGNDVLTGGDGVDTADYSAAAGGVVASLAGGAALDDGDGGSDTLTGIENLTGSAHNDVLTGDSGANLLAGGMGDDVLIGGGGNDTLNGGAGFDTASYADAAAGVTVRLNHSTAQDGDGGTDVLNSIENVTGSDFNDLLVGDANANVLSGGLGADYLIGLAGDDVLIGGAGAANTLQGGLGDDTYVVSANDTIVEFAGEGTDTVQTDRAAFTLGANLENLVYTGAAAFTGSGNALDNVITGGDGADILRGGGGDDTLNGGLGADTAVMSGVSSEYQIEDLGGGQFRITDTVGGRDGVDLLNGIEQVRFANGDVIDLVPGAAAPAVSGKGAAGPQVLPLPAEDDFLVGKDVDLPLVLPATDDPFLGLGDLGRVDGLVARTDHFMLTLGENGPPPQRDGLDEIRGDDGWAF